MQLLGRASQVSSAASPLAAPGAAGPPLSRPLSPLRAGADPIHLSRGRAAFSLVEILVAVGLISVIMLALMAMLNQTQRAFRGSLAQVDVMEAGRSVMDLIRHDLARLAVSEYTNLITFSNYEAENFTPATALVQALSGGSQRTNILQDFYVLTRLDNDLWQAIGYSIDATNGAGTLYRALFETNRAGVASIAVPQPSATPPATASLPTADFHRVADGVVHLQLRAYRGDGLRAHEDGTNTVTVIENGIYEDYTYLGTNSPALIEVELGVLEPKTWEQFKARAYNRAFLEGKADKVHLFRQTIPIRSVK